MVKKVLNFEPYADDALIAQGFEVKHGCGPDAASVIAAAQECEAILVRTEPITAGVLEALPALKIVSRYGAGFDNIDVEAANRLGIWATNVPDCNTGTVAEGAIAMLLMLGRKFGILEKALRAGGWELRNRCRGSELGGKALGVVGLGKIGRAVARKALYGLDMEVCAYDPFVPQEQAPHGVRMIGDWEKIFSVCDYISMHMPYLGKTMVRDREFGLMKPAAYFLNLSRGPLVDEEALIRALRQGKIAGAGLDVFASEPPEPDNPLFSMENVMVLPHATGISVESVGRSRIQSSKSIGEALAGQVPGCAVNHPVNPRNLR